MSARPVTRAIVAAAGGRELEVFTAGPADGPAVLLLHGTPSCGMLFDGWVEACAARGVRLVGYSRPGYGASTRHAGRSVADCAADVTVVATALGLRDLCLVGHSGGGSHALACAALLPDRVRAAAVIAGAAPRDAEGLDWLAGQGEENVQEWRAALAGGERLRALLERWREEMLDGSDDDAGEGTESLGSLVSDADRASITPETAAFAAVRRRHALAPGIWGWYDDDLTETKHWGFELRSICVPVAVWHGGQDGFVPYAHGEWLAANVPGAVPRLDPAEGHFSIVDRRFGDVVGDLLALAAG